MSHWMQLDADKLDRKEKPQAGRIGVEVSLSPYDIPLAVRGYRAENNFIVEFRYMGDEPTVIRAPRDRSDIKFVVGKNSGRLYRVLLDLGTAVDRFIEGDSKPQTQITKRISDAIGRLEEKEKTFTSRSRLDLAKEIVSRNGSILTGALTGRAAH